MPSGAVPAAVTLILGGARSGKSRHGEALVAAAAAGDRATCVATAEPRDAEMAARIAAHRARRGSNWITVEEPLEVPRALAGIAGPVLVDCLTLWLANLMAAGRDPGVEGEALAAALRRGAGPAVLVASEVGLGIVPANGTARAFRDAAGLLHQRIAAGADRVVLMAAGLPLDLKAPAAAGR